MSLTIETNHDFLGTSNKQSKSDIKETIPLTTASKKSKILGIDLANEVQGLYAENCPMSLKKA